MDLKIEKAINTTTRRKSTKRPLTSTVTEHVYKVPRVLQFLSLSLSQECRSVNLPLRQRNVGEHNTKEQDDADSRDHPSAA